MQHWNAYPIVNAKWYDWNVLCENNSMFSHSFIRLDWTWFNRETMVLLWQTDCVVKCLIFRPWFFHQWIQDLCVHIQDQNWKIPCIISSSKVNNILQLKSESTALGVRNYWLTVCAWIVYNENIHSFITQLAYEVCIIDVFANYNIFAKDFLLEMAFRFNDTVTNCVCVCPMLST